MVVGSEFVDMGGLIAAYLIKKPFEKCRRKHQSDFPKMDKQQIKYEDRRPIISNRLYPLIGPLVFFLV